MYMNDELSICNRRERLANALGVDAGDIYEAGKEGNRDANK